MPSAPEMFSVPVMLPPARLSLAVSSRRTSLIVSFQSFDRMLSPCDFGNGGSGVSGISVSFPSKRDVPDQGQFESVGFGHGVEDHAVIDHAARRRVEDPRLAQRFGSVGFVEIEDRLERYAHASHRGATAHLFVELAIDDVRGLNLFARAALIDEPGLVIGGRSGV